MVFSYWQNPPEVNSALFTFGPHEFSWRQASIAWGTINAAIATTIMDMNSLLATLSGLFQGTTATAAKLVIQPGLLWLESMQMMAEKYMMENEAVADSFSALAAEIPQFPLITLNRETCFALEGSNFLGINTPEIITLESEYAQMWVQAASTLTTWDASITELTLPTPTPPSPLLTHAMGDISSFAAVEGRLGANLGQAVRGRILSEQAESDETRQQTQQLTAHAKELVDGPAHQSTNQAQDDPRSLPTQNVEELLSSMMSPLSGLGSLASLAGNGFQPGTGLTQPALQNLESMMSQGLRSGIGTSIAESHFSVRSHLPSEIHHRIHSTGGTAYGGISYRSAALSSVNSHKNDTRPLSIAGLPTPGNLRANYGPIGNLGTPGLGNRPAKSSETPKAERKFLDDVDAFGELIQADQENTQSEKRNISELLRKEPACLDRKQP